jgi:hypothetical protein
MAARCLGREGGRKKNKSRIIKNKTFVRQILSMAEVRTVVTGTRGGTKELL